MTRYMTVRREGTTHMKCPTCGCIDDLEATVSLEQWNNTDDNAPDAQLFKESWMVCGNCHFRGNAETFGLDAAIRFVHLEKQ